MGTKRVGTNLIVAPGEHGMVLTEDPLISPFLTMQRAHRVYKENYGKQGQDGLPLDLSRRTRISIFFVVYSPVLFYVFELNKTYKQDANVTMERTGPPSNNVANQNVQSTFLDVVTDWELCTWSTSQRQRKWTDSQPTAQLRTRWPRDLAQTVSNTSNLHPKHPQLSSAWALTPATCTTGVLKHQLYHENKQANDKYRSNTLQYNNIAQLVTNTTEGILSPTNNRAVSYKFTSVPSTEVLLTALAVVIDQKWGFLADFTTAKAMHVTTGYCAPSSLVATQLVPMPNSQHYQSTTLCQCPTPPANIHRRVQSHQYKKNEHPTFSFTPTTPYLTITMVYGGPL